jgi:hypothetical protein
VKILLSIFLVTIAVLGGLGQAVTFTSSNLPIVVINTNGVAIADEPKIVADMGIIDNGPGAMNFLSDPRNNYNGKIGIELRGSSSQMFPKKQFGIELKDAQGNDLQQSLLGLPAEEDWILFAPYNDKTLMRDVLAYKLSRDMGRYASRYRFVELVLNGDYKGVYVLLEKIKRNEMRVDIADLDIDENAGDELTGGYILKIDKTSGSGGGQGFASAFPPNNRAGDQTIYFQYEYPKGEEITQAQQGYIRNFIGAFEAKLRGTSWLDPINGYRPYVDISSFIDFFILNELSKNVDGYRLSTFLYKDKDSKGGRLHMGPAWDFNLGFGNANYCTNWEPQGFVKDFNTLCPGDYWLIPFWWDRLWADPGFRTLLFSRWQSLRSGPLETDLVHTYIDSVANVLGAAGAQQRNFQRWPVLGEYVWPNPYVYATLLTYDAEVDWFKSWVSERFAWLDQSLEYAITGVDDVAAETLITVKPYPNPFVDQLSFDYTLARPATVAINVYDALGRLAETIHATHLEAGSYTAASEQQSLAPGLYFYRVTVDGQPCVSGQLSKGSRE